MNTSHMPYELKLAQYSGPLDKLLELIEAKQLQITEISLAQVTDDFLRYLESLKDPKAGAVCGDRENMRLLADFIVVASRLIFIKSKSLLPDLVLSEEEEADIRDLETRLKLYRELRPSFRLLGSLWHDRRSSFSRPYFLNLAHWMMPRPDTLRKDAGDLAFFYPGEDLSAATLQESLRRTFASFESFIKDSAVIRDTMVSLEEKIKEIVARMKDVAESSFRSLSANKPRGEIIVIFLAILHLVREQLLCVEQLDQSSDIIIKKNHSAV